MISCCIPEEQENNVRLNTISGMQNAANVLQKAYITGIESITGRRMHLINATPVGTFPLHYKKPFIKKSNEVRKGILTDNDISYLNMQYMTNGSKYIAMRKHVRKWLNTGNGSQKVLIGYAMIGYVLDILSYAKKLNPNVITCLIVPDLPQYMSDNSHKIYKKIWYKHALSKYNKNKSKIDCYSLITEQCAKYLGLTENYVVIEGMYDSKESEKNEAVMPHEKTVMYTGGLYAKYGVKELINGFKRIPTSDLKLELYGDGDLKSEIIAASIEDHRIKYGGLISRNDCLVKQRNAFCLINPRQESSYTEYSFPSKLIEFLASGSPTICYMLKGIPDEYKDYIIPIGAEDDGVSRAIRKVIEMTSGEYANVGDRGMQFVREEKNPVVQCSKLIDLIGNIIDTKVQK